MELKYIEDKQNDTPYFEMVFAYNFMSIIVLAPNFVGFDGSFCIATNHLRLKLKILAHKVSLAFRDAKSRGEIEIKLKESIKDHQDVLVFYNDIQEVYGGWLFAAFLLTSITSEQLSRDLYGAAWEEWPDPVLRRLLMFMITKSQQTFILTGNGLVYFNMQLFI
ncbi:unnamed protein product, partial [Brenthis ino]